MIEIFVKKDELKDQIYSSDYEHLKIVRVYEGKCFGHVMFKVYK
jgi:hypothetical protein